MSGKFYTSVDVVGSTVLVREVVDGVRSNRKDKWKPTVFISSQNPTEYKSLYGANVRKFKPESIKECREFVKKYENTSGIEIFGQLNYSLQYMSEYDLQGDHSIKDFLCYSLDIECMAPLAGGFPKPEYAMGEINLITVQNINTKQCYTFGTLKKPADCTYTNYTECIDEHNLLRLFLQFWEQNIPDIITGWNIEGFDIPYLINRITKILGEDAARKLSPWGVVECNNVDVEDDKGNITTEIKFKVLGVQMLDYSPLMKKFIPGGRESWTLGSVAQEVIGETKRENPGETFEEFYTLYPDMFISYNVQDSVLVTKLDDKLNLLSQAITMAYFARVNFSEVYSPVKMWDNIMHNKLIAENIVIPQRKNSGFSGKSIEGAYVMAPTPGMYEDVGSIDATSLYPSLMRQMNLSPETFVGMIDSTVEMCLEGVYANTDENYAMGANGALFDKSKEGIIPRLITEYMALRKTTKSEMLKLEQDVENFKKNGQKEEAAKLGNKISSLNNLQNAIKILMNSLYGAMANKGFRFFNPDIAESITLTGQLYLRKIEQDIDAILVNLFKLPKTKLMIYADTDSVYFCLKAIIDKYAPDATPEQKITLIEKLTKEKIVPCVNKVTEAVSKSMNAYKHTIVFKPEIAADKALWLGKKMYVCRVHSSEGVRYAAPKFKTMGISLVRSTTPKVVQKSLRNALDTIFTKTEKDVQKFIEETKTDFMKNTVESIARPTGVNGLDKWGSTISIYQPKTPIHVRAALLHNGALKKFKLENKYEPIGEGDKMKYVYLKVPNPIRENVIGWSADGKLPHEFGLEKYIDWDLQFEKTFLDSIKKIIEPIGWHTEHQATLWD